MANYGSRGYPGYGAPSNYPSVQHPRGTTVIVLGIVSLGTCFILGIIAVVMGKKALNEIDANPGAYDNRSTVKAGVICGVISIIWQGAIVAIDLVMNIIGFVTGFYHGFTGS